MRMLELHLECDDLEAAITFYTRLLPHDRLVWNGPGDPQAFIVLREGTALGLWERGARGIHDGRGGRHVHWALQIAPEEYDAYKSKIGELGCEALEWEWPDGAKSVYFFDADGHQGEFMTTDWHRRKGSSGVGEPPDTP
jgi:catechol 2,3-dioxygenase-like lactoylglutathione lyase family enzyme